MFEEGRLQRQAEMIAKILKKKMQQQLQQQQQQHFQQPEQDHQAHGGYGTDEMESLSDPSLAAPAPFGGGAFGGGFFGGGSLMGSSLTKATAKALGGGSGAFGSSEGGGGFFGGGGFGGLGGKSLETGGDDGSPTDVDSMWDGATLRDPPSPSDSPLPANALPRPRSGSLRPSLCPSFYSLHLPLRLSPPPRLAAEADFNADFLAGDDDDEENTLGSVGPGGGRSSSGGRPSLFERGPGIRMDGSSILVHPDPRPSILVHQDLVESLKPQLWDAIVTGDVAGMHAAHIQAGGGWAGTWAGLLEPDWRGQTPAHHTARASQLAEQGAARAAAVDEWQWAQMLAPTPAAG